jgi:hypothetical protein
MTKQSLRKGESLNGSFLALEDSFARKVPGTGKNGYLPVIQAVT